MSAREFFAVIVKHAFDAFNLQCIFIVMQIIKLTVVVVVVVVVRN